MSRSADHSSSDASLHDRAHSELAALVTNDPVPAPIVEHIASCAECGAEFAALRRVAELARGRAGTEALTDVPAPPLAVWERIARQVGDAPAGSGPAPATRRRRPTAWVVRSLAAAVVVAGIGVGGWAIGRASGSNTSASAGHAVLSAQPGTSAAASGTATMRSTVDGYQLQLDTRGLPASSGYYEVWLYDPSTGRMIAVGTLGLGARGTFTVPAGIDTHAYDVLDVSDQRYAAGPQHQRSVLRGPLTLR